MGNNIEASVSKRHKTNNSVLPIATVIFAKYGDKSGSVPELMCSRFYDCTREINIGKVHHHLRIKVNRRVGKKLKLMGKGESCTIPVLLENIEGVSVLSGMTSFKKLLVAHNERATLRMSIVNWIKLIEKRRITLSKKEIEYQNLPEIGDEPVEKEEKTSMKEADVNDDVDMLNVDDDTTVNMEDDDEERQRKIEERAEKQKLAREKRRLADEKKRAARKKFEAEKKE